MADQIELPSTGMTCASGANRIERKLNELDGVDATVNYATEKAAVSYDPAAVAPEQLLAAVEAAGDQAGLPASQTGDGTKADAGTAPADDAAASLRLRLLV